MSSILVENGTKELAKFVGICLWAFSGANIYIYIYLKVMKPTWLLRLKAIMPRFWINTANQSSAHGLIDFASIRISFGKMIKSIS